MRLTTAQLSVDHDERFTIDDVTIKNGVVMISTPSRSIYVGTISQAQQIANALLKVIEPYTLPEHQ